MKEFDPPKTEGSIESHFKGTIRKYYLCLQGFFKYSNAKEYSAFDSLFQPKMMSKVEHTGQTITPLEVVNVYVELVNSPSIEDVIVIHLMYSLSINPSTVALLNFEFIDEKKNLAYFNTKTLSFATV